MKLIWDEDAWDDYCWWQTQDRKILKRINALPNDIVQARTSQARVPRLLVKVENDEVRIAGCRYDYGR